MCSSDHPDYSHQSYIAVNLFKSFGLIDCSSFTVVVVFTKQLLIYFKKFVPEMISKIFIIVNIFILRPVFYGFMLVQYFFMNDSQLFLKLGPGSLWCLCEMHNALQQSVFCFFFFLNSISLIQNIVEFEAKSYFTDHQTANTIQLFVPKNMSKNLSTLSIP